MLRTDVVPGQEYVLVEEGGAAKVLVTSMSLSTEWIGYHIRFLKIYRQYPYVPYQPGDEIDIGYNPSCNPYAGGWRLDPVSYYEFKA